MSLLAAFVELVVVAWLVLKEVLFARGYDGIPDDDGDGSNYEKERCQGLAAGQGASNIRAPTHM